jgi:hypothetical protein
MGVKLGNGNTCSYKGIYVIVPIFPVIVADLNKIICKSLHALTGLIRINIPFNILLPFGIVATSK